MKMPDVKQEYFPLGGGLDLVTPAIARPPGRTYNSQNYEPEIVGGYRRINGYERFDGHDSPSEADYWILSINQTGAISVGDTLTGGTSGATCKVLEIVAGDVVAGRLTGSFIDGENLTNGVVVGTVATPELLNGATDPSDDADYRLLAANDKRLDILAVPGSGVIRGVHVYNDTVYAFRDNAGGTAGDMYKSTTGGWVKINFGTEIQFTGATGQISAGNTITGATSGATATVIVAMLRTGSWTASGAGTLIITVTAGTFQNGENLQVGGVTKVVSASLATAITRAAGGRVRCVNYNFTGSTATEKVYGADGVNKAFEFDGTNYIPIRTGMTTDTPKHVICWKNYLWLSFLGSAQFSGLGAPYSWSVVLGAGEIATGDEITGFVPQGGTSDGSSLAIFTKKRMHVLYGNSSSDFKLVTSQWDMGFSAYTMQVVGNNTYGMTARGIQATVTTLTYGDFDYTSISHLIQPLIQSKLGLEIESTTLRSKNQYRLYYSDGTALVIGLTGDKPNGILPLDYGKTVRCMTTATLTDGTEVTYFGSDDGYIYQDNVGTSFDGDPIEAWIRPSFNNNKSPRIRKRYRRAVLELTVDSYARVNISYDIGYGSPDAAAAATQADQELIGTGGYWDQFNWDEFSWDSAVVNSPSISVEGTEKNIGLIFYSNRAQDGSHTLQGCTLLFTPQRLERG